MSQLCYRNYDKNQKLVEAFMMLAHQMYCRSYAADALHVGNGIANLESGWVYYVSFDLGGQGIYSQSVDPNHLGAEIKVCQELHFHSRGDVYKFEAEAENYILIEQYTYRR